MFHKSERILLQGIVEVSPEEFFNCAPAAAYTRIKAKRPTTEQELERPVPIIRREGGSHDPEDLEAEDAMHLAEGKELEKSSSNRELSMRNENRWKEVMAEAKSLRHLRNENRRNQNRNE